MRMVFVLCLLMIAVENINIMLHLKRSGVPRCGITIGVEDNCSIETSNESWLYTMIALHLIVTTLCVFMKENTNNSMLILLSVLFFEGGMGLYVLAEREMKTSWRYGIRTNVDKLVKEGIYSSTRNPALLGMTLMMFSVTLLSESPFAIITLVAYLLSQNVYMTAEEDYLKSRFKEEYEVYYKEVPRLFMKKFTVN